MVSIAVTAAVPEMAAGVVVVQAGTSTAPEVLAATAHVSATLPVKPPLGVMVTVEVVDSPGSMGVVEVSLNENVAPDPKPWIT
jgi:hypothetical protein